MNRVRSAAHSGGRTVRPARKGRVVALLLLLFAGYFTFCLITGRVSLLVLSLYLGLSLATCIAYGIDKLSAQSQQRRIREDTLHMLSLLGGWPGAFLAQQVIRHKSSKQSFQIVFVATVLTNLFGFILFSSPEVRSAIRNLMASTPPAAIEPERPPEDSTGIIISPLQKK